MGEEKKEEEIHTILPPPTKILGVFSLPVSPEPILFSLTKVRSHCNKILISHFVLSSKILTLPSPRRPPTGLEHRAGARWWSCLSSRREKGPTPDFKSLNLLPNDRL